MATLTAHYTQPGHCRSHLEHPSEEGLQCRDTKRRDVPLLHPRERRPSGEPPAPTAQHNTPSQLLGAGYASSTTGSGLCGLRAAIKPMVSTLSRRRSCWPVFCAPFARHVATCAAESGCTCHRFVGFGGGPPGGTRRYLRQARARKFQKAIRHMGGGLGGAPRTGHQRFKRDVVSTSRVGHLAQRGGELSLKLGVQ